MKINKKDIQKEIKMHLIDGITFFENTDITTNNIMKGIWPIIQELQKEPSEMFMVKITINHRIEQPFYFSSKEKAEEFSHAIFNILTEQGRKQVKFEHEILSLTFDIKEIIKIIIKYKIDHRENS